MDRIAQPPRPDARARAAALGFAFAEIAGEPYWDESAHYRFTSDEVDALEAATAELERLSREATEHAFRRDRREALGLSPGAWALARASWEAGEPSLYGRMDLRWDGAGPPLLLEYNADTPTALYEAAVVQWEWLQCVAPEADQFNGLHEALIAAWPALRLPTRRVHFCCDADSEEDRGTVDYLRDTALQAGLEAPFLAVDHIGWDGLRGAFTDADEERIEAIFKLYPWDWLLAEDFGRHVPRAPGTRWIEPAWRMLPTGKGFLSLLWELFPGHANLLPAFREPGRTGGPELSKPYWGREGSNVAAPGGAAPTPGPYGANPRVWQSYAELPRFGGRYPVLGSWVIAGRPAGLGIRDDDTPITRDTSRFVPHLFTPDPDPAPDEDAPPPP